MVKKKIVNCLTIPIEHFLSVGHGADTLLHVNDLDKNKEPPFIEVYFTEEIDFSEKTLEEEKNESNL